LFDAFGGQRHDGIFQRLAQTQNLSTNSNMSNTQSKPESEIAELMVTVLNLEIDPGTIDPEAPLFYEGLGLDSIDALEMALELSKKYSVELRADDENNGQIFASLRNLAGFVMENKAG
jgi:acyl carrier protein